MEKEETKFAREEFDFNKIIKIPRKVDYLDKKFESKRKKLKFTEVLK